MTGDPARTRFAIINAVRFAGVVLVLLGFVATRRWFGLPDAVPYVLMAAGLLGVFAAPLLLARHWRTPK